MRELWRDTELKSERMFNEIDTENLNQLNKWGIQEHTLFEWLTYTMEELGELAQACSEYTYRDGKLKQIRKEAIQVATLAVKIADMAHEKIVQKMVRIWQPKGDPE